MKRIINKIYRLISRKDLAMGWDKEFLYMALRVASNKLGAYEKAYILPGGEFQPLGDTIVVLFKHGNAQISVHKKEFVVDRYEEDDCAAPSCSDTYWKPPVYPDNKGWLKETIVHMGENIPERGQICCSLIKEGICGVASTYKDHTGFQIKLKTQYAVKAAFQSDCYSIRLKHGLSGKRRPKRTHIKTFRSPQSLINAIKNSEYCGKTYNELLVEASQILAIRKIEAINNNGSLKIKPTSRWMSRVN